MSPALTSNSIGTLPMGSTIQFNRPLLVSTDPRVVVLAEENEFKQDGAEDHLTIKNCQIKIRSAESILLSGAWTIQTVRSIQRVFDANYGTNYTEKVEAAGLNSFTQKSPFLKQFDWNKSLSGRRKNNVVTVSIHKTGPVIRRVFAASVFHINAQPLF